MRFKISSFFEHTFFAAALLQTGCWLWFGSEEEWEGVVSFPTFSWYNFGPNKRAKDNAAPAKTQTPRKFSRSKGSTVGKWSHAGHWKLAGCRLVLVACGSLCSVHPLVIYVVPPCEASNGGILSRRDPLLTMSGWIPADSTGFWFWSPELSISWRIIYGSVNEAEGLFPPELQQYMIRVELD